MSFTCLAWPTSSYHKPLVWPCSTVQLPRKQADSCSRKQQVPSCRSYGSSIDRRRQILLQEKGTALHTCHSFPRNPNASSQRTSNSQLFFDLLLVWQQLSSRFSGAEGQHEAHLLLTALKLTIAAQSQQRASRHGPDDRPQAQRAVAVAMLLSDLSASGVPVDAHSIAAAMVIDAVSLGQIPMDVLHRELGMQVCVLVHEIQRVRAAPLSIQVYDEASSAAVREQCLSLCDVRAVLIEVVCRLDQLQNCQRMGIAKQQVLALQVLQIFSPLGHALGLSVASARLEDLSFEILFGESYRGMRAWMHSEQDRWLAVLTCIKAQAQTALDSDEGLRKLAVRAYVSTRAKSSYSLMKKLLTLSDFSRGGKAISETYDVLGMRVVVESSNGEPLEEIAGHEGCYRAECILQELFCSVPERRKDYISTPKPNGYKSLHIAVEVPDADVLEAWGLLEPGVMIQGESGSGAAAGGSVDMLEIQIRTECMHAAAEQGDTSHTLYKSGVDMQKSARLHDWIEALMHAFSATQASFRIERWASPSPSASIDCNSSIHPSATSSATAANPQQSHSLSGFSSILADPSDHPCSLHDSWTVESRVVSMHPATTPTHPEQLVTQADLSMHKIDSSSRDSTVKSSLLQNIPECPGASRPELTEVAVRQLFDHLDRNGDGEISTEEIQKVLKDLGGDSAAAEAATLVATLTQQRGVNGRITFDDLLNFQQSCSPSAAVVVQRQGSVVALPPCTTVETEPPVFAESTDRPQRLAAVEAPSTSTPPVQSEKDSAAHDDLLRSGDFLVEVGEQLLGAGQCAEAHQPLRRQIGYALKATWGASPVPAVPVWRLPLVRGMPFSSYRSLLAAATASCSSTTRSRPRMMRASACVAACSVAGITSPLSTHRTRTSAPCMHGRLGGGNERRMCVVVKGRQAGASGRAAVKTIDRSSDANTKTSSDAADAGPEAVKKVATGTPLPKVVASKDSKPVNGTPPTQNGSSSASPNASRGTLSSSSTDSVSSVSPKAPSSPKAAASASSRNGKTVPRRSHRNRKPTAAATSTAAKPNSATTTTAGTTTSVGEPSSSPSQPTPEDPQATSTPSPPSPSSTPPSRRSVQPVFKWAAPRSVNEGIPLLNTSDSPPQKRQRSTSSSSTPPTPTGPSTPISFRINEEPVPDTDISTSYPDGNPDDSGADFDATLYTEDEADRILDPPPSTLQSIDPDQIPGGLGLEGWEASDILSLASPISRDLKNASMYTLELDDSTAELLDNVIGAVVYVDGGTALVVPARGPLVIGAQKFRGCDVVVSEPRLSGRHVFFELRGMAEGADPQLIVTDMASTNGVFVNGKRCAPWKPKVVRTGDVIHLTSQQVARFRVGALKRDGKGLREASTIAALVDDLKTDKFFMSDRAWRENRLQRLALGCVLHPTSHLTKKALLNSGTPPVALALPKTSLKDVAEAAIPLAAWTTINRDKKIRDFLRKGQVAQTVQFLNRMAVNYPTDPRIWIYLAEMRLYHDRDYPAARVACRAAFEACNIARTQLQKLVNAGYHHEDKLHRLDLIWLHALMTAALVEWRAKLYTPARRLFEDAIREAPTCGALAMQFVAWTWADCELQQGRAAMATEVLNRALHTCKTPALILLLAKAELKAGKKTRAKKRLARLSERFPSSSSVAFSHANACIDMDAPLRALRLLQALQTHLDSSTIDASMRAALHACEARALVALGNTEQAVYQISDAARTLQNRKFEKRDIQNHEWHHWLDLKDPRQARALPHLVVHTIIRSAQYENTWADIEIAQARLDLSRAVVETDPAASYELAREVISSGKLQVPAHCAAAKAALEMLPEGSSSEDTQDARKHLSAGLRLDANSTGVLSVFLRWLEVQGDSQGAAAVRQFLQEMKRAGVGRIAPDVQAPAHEAIDNFLRSSVKSRK